METDVRRGAAKGAAKGVDAAAKEAFLSDWGSAELSASSADYYFDSYHHYGVHEEVLKDSVTTSAYERAIRRNAHLFRGKVVLDVCAGLGLYSLLAAKAGARRVVALEPQPELAAIGRRVAEHNGFGPEVLEFVVSSASALERLPDGIEQVDVIVSGWLGYFLLYEARLPDVLCARDRWLKPGGLLFPDRARLHLGLAEDATYGEQHFDFYDNVWGYDFSPMKGAAHTEPVVSLFDPAQLVSSGACVLDLDLYTAKAADALEMASRYSVVCTREGQASALLFWFEVRFGSCHTPVSFATGPDSAPTCWKQTALFLDGAPLGVKQGDRVRGMVAVRKPSEARRHMDIKASCRVNSGKPREMFYRWS